MHWGGQTRRNSLLVQRRKCKQCCLHMSSYRTAVITINSRYLYQLKYVFCDFKVVEGIVQKLLPVWFLCSSFHPFFLGQILRYSSSRPGMVLNWIEHQLICYCEKWWLSSVLISSYTDMPYFLASLYINLFIYGFNELWQISWINSNFSQSYWVSDTISIE